MKAVVQHEYGPAVDVLALAEVERPEPADDRVLVRVEAAGVTAGVWHLVRGLPYMVRLMGYGLRRPKTPIPGNDVAGVVEAVGRDVSGFAPGDEVFGVARGAFAEYATAAPANLALKPPDVSFPEAAVIVESGLTALQGLRDHGGLEAGQKVLINGASGGVGHYAVQIAKAMGAIVTGVCSGRNAAMVKRLAADRVIDYTQEDFTRGGGYDLILDMIGNHSLSSLRKALLRSGTLVVVGTSGGRVLQGAGRFLGAKMLTRFVPQTIRSFVAKNDAADLEVLRGLVEQGKLAPVIQRSYPLAEAGTAVAVVEQGHVAGKVVVSVANP